MPTLLSLTLLTLATLPTSQGLDQAPVRHPGPYDFGAATTLLETELPQLSNRVAVLVHQDGREIYRFQHGSIDMDTQTQMASLTKSISATVILSAAEDGLLQLDERLGDAFPVLFGGRGIGEPTVLDCWAMRHGIDARLAYEHLSAFNHWQSVRQIGRKGYTVFPAGEKLGYDGAGMQVSGYLAVTRSGLAWEDLARERILTPLGMGQTDYQRFAPNPCVPGGARSTAIDVMRFADMILGEGTLHGTEVLTPDSIERFFTNHTRGLPVESTPFPPAHPSYPYGVDPDYGFGNWILAESPTTQHVEEVVGAGAWGSYVWMDRRRGLTAVLITDVPVGSQSSATAALGLFGIARAQVEARQVTDLVATPAGSQFTLSWTLPAGATGVRIFGSADPIRDVYDLRSADSLGTSPGDQRVVRAYPHYAVTAMLSEHHNEALIPGVNVIAAP